MNFSRRSLFVTLLISILIFSSFAAIGQEGSNQEETTVLATVNGEEITGQDLSQASQVQQIVMTMSRQFRSFAQFLMTSEAGQDFLGEYREHVLDQLIDQELTVQKVEELGITVSDEAVQEEIDGIVEGNEQFEDEGEVEEYLKENQNMTLDDLRASIRENLRSQKLREEVTDEVTVSDEEVETFYNNNKESYTDQEGNVQPLEEVSDQIRSTLKSEKQNEAYSEWLEEERKKADIEKNEDQI